MPSSPTVLAGGQLGLLSRSEVAVAGAAAEDLLEALGRVPDPRDPRGRRYPLVPVLAIAVCAMLAGAIRGLHAYELRDTPGQARSAKLNSRCGVIRNQCVAQSTVPPRLRSSVML